jgi:hypothetical protein
MQIGYVLLAVVVSARGSADGGRYIKMLKCLVFRH